MDASKLRARTRSTLPGFLMVLALSACGGSGGGGSGGGNAPTAPSAGEPPAPIEQPAPADIRANAYRWNAMAMGGGGYVTAVLPSRTQRGLFYARTDVGGAYRYDAMTGRWVNLLDWVSEADSGCWVPSRSRWTPTTPRCSMCWRARRTSATARPW